MTESILGPSSQHSKAAKGDRERDDQTGLGWGVALWWEKTQKISPVFK